MRGEEGAGKVERRQRGNRGGSRRGWWELTRGRGGGGGGDGKERRTVSSNRPPRPGSSKPHSSLGSTSSSNAESTNSPFILRLNGPSLSSAKESAPHWRTTAPGRYQSMMACMTCSVQERRKEQEREDGGSEDRRKRKGQDQLGSTQASSPRNPTHRPEHPLVTLIINPIFERKVDRIPLALALASIAQRAGSRKVVAKLVERGRHDPVRGVEGFFYAVAMVYVDVDVQDAGVVSLV